jgi:hypothetical protein
MHTGSDADHTLTKYSRSDCMLRGFTENVLLGTGTFSKVKLYVKESTFHAVKIVQLKDLDIK